MAGLDGKVGIRYQLLPDSLLQPGVCSPTTLSALVFSCFHAEDPTWGMGPKMDMAKNWERAALGFVGHSHIRKGVNQNANLLWGL